MSTNKRTTGGAVLNITSDVFAIGVIIAGMFGIIPPLYVFVVFAASVFISYATSPYGTFREYAEDTFAKAMTKFKR